MEYNAPQVVSDFSPEDNTPILRYLTRKVSALLECNFILDLFQGQVMKKHLQNASASVELLAGIEPATSSLPWMRAAYCAKEACRIKYATKTI